MNATTSIKTDGQDSNFSQTESLSSSKNSDENLNEVKMRSKARNEMIDKINANCLEMYVFASPVCYYTPILFSAWMCRRKPLQIVPLVLGTGIARQSDYSITEIAKNGLNIADGMKRDVMIENKTLFEYCTEYNAEKKQFHLNWSAFMSVVLTPTEIALENHKYYADHSNLLHSRINLEKNKPRINIDNANLCNLL